MTVPAYFRLEPTVEPRDYRLGGASWEELDLLASGAIGAPGFVIPSIRVAILWTLEHLGFRRHTDHLLIPRFVGRCILNTINRAALPVENWTPATKAMLVVQQFGLRQRLDEVQAESQARGIPFLEDSPFGPEPEEQVASGSLARFVGLAKVLPVLKGGFAMTGDATLAATLKRRRQSASGWSWPLLGALAAVRHSPLTKSYSATADLAYELYPESPADNPVLRGNLRSGLMQMPAWERMVADRIASVRGAIGDRALVPEASRLAAVVPCLTEEADDATPAAFQRNGFDPTRYHVDVNRSLLSPSYRSACLVPVHPRVPRDHFDRLIEDLRGVR